MQNDLLNERAKTHGDFDQVALTARAIKALFSRANLSPTQREALDMIASKLGRIANGNANEPDHWRDIAGYAELVVRHLRRQEIARIADEVRNV